MSGKATGVHRLTDLKVEEVSLVDKPANRSPFLIVKRDEETDTMAAHAAQIVEKEDGTLVLEEVDKDAAATAEAAAEAKKKKDKAAADKKKAAADADDTTTKTAAQKAGALLIEAGRLLGKGDLDDHGVAKVESARVLVADAAKETPVTTEKGDDGIDPVVLKEAGLLGKADDGAALLDACGQLVLKTTDGADLAAVANVLARIVKGAAKPADKDADDKDKGKGGRRFTAARTAKLISGLTDILSVMKDIGVENLPALLAIAKREGNVEGQLVAKRIEDVGIEASASAPDEGLAKRLADTEARLAKVEAAGVSKAAGSDGTTTGDGTVDGSTKVEKSVFEGVV